MAAVPTQCEDITLKLRGGEIAFKGMQYLLGFALPNFYFHVTTAYNSMIRVHIDSDSGK